MSKVTSSKQKVAFSTSENTIVTRLKTIISEETGLDIRELDSDISFPDSGIDSLMSLTISSRLQEELGLNLSSTSFIDFATLSELIAYAVPSNSASSCTSGSSTPYLQADEEDLGNETDATSVDEPEVMALIRATIAEEVGVPSEELTATTDFLELGVDSLLSLTIIGRLVELGVEVPSDLLMETHNLQQIEETLNQNGVLVKPRAADLEAAVQDKPLDRIPPFAPYDLPHATSVRLQGASSNTRKILFLFPDGAGSATSYASLPTISPDIVVYGLNCPWMKAPEEIRCSLPQYVSKFIAEIRRRQPTGPYYLGGWSAGGILAYEAAQQLAHDGQTTAKLFLLDSPNPIGIQSPPPRMYDFLESLNMFGLGDRKTPSWLRPHFTVIIDMLDQYQPVPFSGKTTPTTHVIYARDGLCENPGDPILEVKPGDGREMHWLLNHRTDFNAGGWKQLIGGENVQVDVVDNANHYTILARVNSARAVSQLVAGYLAN